TNSLAWEADLVTARPSETWLRQDVEAAERWAQTYPRHQFAMQSGRPTSPPIGARAGSADLPCKEVELGSSPRCSTNLILDLPMVGCPVVTRTIQVRVLVEEPIHIRRGRLLEGHAGSHPTDRSSSLRRGTNARTRSSTGQSP